MSQLELCNAFFGARPGAVTLHHRVADVKQIRFVDVTSECPWVNKNGQYPLGHPIILYEPENQDPSVYNGLLKVDVLPLAELFHSVLPYRHKMSSGWYKLTFPFCAKCVEEESIKPMLARSFICSHTDSEQCLRGTWCSPELNKAIAFGYRVPRIHEVRHFEELEEGLFVRMSTHGSRLNRKVQDTHPGITTKHNMPDMYRNTAKKKESSWIHQKLLKVPDESRAKLMLNSFWGKFGQQTNKSTTTQLSEACHLFELLDDPLVEVQEIRIFVTRNCGSSVLGSHLRPHQRNDDQRFYCCLYHSHGLLKIV